MEQMPQNAVNIINASTKNKPAQWFYIFMGPHKRHERQILMTALLGRKATIKESGMYALEDMLMEYVDTRGCVCHAQRQSRLVDVLTQA